jgi:predicted methyltransferase
MRIILKTGAAAPAVALAQACTRPRALAPEPAPASMDYSVSAETPGRPDADILTDAKRNPAEVLALFALQAGDTVVEIEADGGYFTEFLSRAVGATGKV